MSKVLNIAASPLSIIDKDLGVAAQAVTLIAAGIITGNPALVIAGISRGASLFVKKPKLPGAGQTKWKADPNAGIPYAIGRTGLAGNIIYKRAGGGSDNPYQTLVTVLSGAGPIQSIDEFYLDNVLTTFNGAGAINGRLVGLAWQRTQLGASPEATALATPAPTVPTGWTAAHKLSGMAASILTYKYDTKGKVTLTALPEPRWVGHWVKVYDPRLDSTYPGGSGACRALNEATYVWSENPYLHGLTWLLGRYQNGKRVLGVGLPVWAIDVAAYVEGANIADANGWTCGGLVYSSDDKWQVLKAMLQAGGGEPSHLGARISCLVSTPRVSLGTITADDLRGDVTVTATQSRRERFNTVIARYRSEAEKWQIVPTPPISVASHVAEDGGQRTKEIEYPLVQVAAGAAPNQPAQLARYDIENAREFGPIVAPCRTRFIGFKPGDCLDITVPEVGLNAQQILILNKSTDPATGIVTLTSRSETAAKHPFALGQTTTAPATPGVTGPPLAPVPQPGSWSITATSISAGGIEQPILQISGAIDSTVADGIVFEYRTAFVGQAAGVGWIAAGIEQPSTTLKVIGPIKPSTSYEVAVSYRARGGIGDRLILGPVTSGNLSGLSGPGGTSVGLLRIFKRAPAGSPPALPSATVTVTLADLSVSGLNNGWTRDPQAANGQPQWVSVAPISTTGSSDTIASGEWAVAVVDSQDGINGANGYTATVAALYQRNNTGTPPATPSSTLTFDFTTGILSGTLGAWSQGDPPAANGKYLFRTVAPALAAAPATSDTIAAGEWQVATEIVKDGTDGAPGDPGAPGAAGFTVSPGSTSFSINAFANGTPKTGQFDKTVTFKVLQGAADISDEAATTYVLLSATACTAALGGTNGKVLTISAMSADDAKVIVSVRRSGVEIARPEVELRKAYDGTKFNSGSSAVTSMPNSSTFSQIATAITLTVPNGAALSIAGHAQWFATGVNSYAGEIRASYQNVTDGGAETFGSTAAGDQTATSSEQATADCSAGITNGTGASKSFTVRLYGRRASGAGAGATVDGSLEASVS